MGKLITRRFPTGMKKKERKVNAFRMPIIVDDAPSLRA
jgi:hypothetical protein